MNWTELADSIHADNIAAGWWIKRPGFATEPRNIGELLCLVHSEISEAADGWRGSLMDDKLPHRRMAEVELADTAIRVLDILGWMKSLAVIGEVSLLGKGRGMLMPSWLMHMHSQVSAAMEGYRKGNDAHGSIRLMELLGSIVTCSAEHEYDLAGAIQEKREFNKNRADHKVENRRAAGGKRF